MEEVDHHLIKTTSNRICIGDLKDQGGEADHHHQEEGADQCVVDLCPEEEDRRRVLVEDIHPRVEKAVRDRLIEMAPL